MATVQIGDRLGGRYELIGELGQGGMSVVYRGRDRQLQREVAVKVMHGFLAEQQDARERFRREAVAVANLKHPHIIEVFDFSGEEGETIYIVAELVDGESLADRLDGEPIRPPEGALVIARPLADALRLAHKAGVIHRDLKPENVLVDSHGALKLTDFGIARLLDNQTLTVTGTLLGSPAYMSPEYIDGKEPDARSDIFSFGAMLYQLVVGELPFVAPSPHALLKRISSGPYTPTNQANPRVHANLARLIHRCLERDPKNRFASAAELLAAIDSLLSHIGLHPDEERPKLLADHQAYVEELEPRLAAIYFDLGKNGLAEGNVAQALDDFDRVLSIEPDNQEVRRRLNKMARRAWVGRVLRDGAIALVGAALVSAGVALAIGEPPPFEPDPVTLPPAALEQEETLMSVPEIDERRQVDIGILGVGDLYVDGELYWDEKIDGSGMGGEHELLLTPGNHTLELVNEHKAARQEIFVPLNGRTPDVEFDVSAPRTSSQDTKSREPQQHPKRKVSFRPAQWVNLFLDGANKPVVENQMAEFTVDLTFGEHTLLFTNPLAKPLEKRILVNKTEPPRTVVIKLEPKDALLRLSDVPDDGFLTIEVAGKKVRITPVNKDDPILVPMNNGREHQVRILREGFVPFSQRVTFTPGKTETLAVKLRRL